MSTKKRIALIDADSLYYKASKDSIEESLLAFDTKLNNILEEVKADYYVAFNSHTPYFRHEVSEAYKSGRKKYPTPLKWLKTLRSYSQEQHQVYSQNKVEADDMIAYFKNKTFYKGVAAYCGPEELSAGDLITIDKRQLEESFPIEELDVVICTADKDVFMLEGITFDYGKWEHRINTKEDEEDFFWRSMYIGDTADSILGCARREMVVTKSGPNAGESKLKRVGITPTKVDDYLDPDNRYTSTLKAYVEFFGEYEGLEEFTKNYKLLKMLDSDEAFIINGLSLPTLKNIVAVNTTVNNTTKLEF